jgi:hypothetical protein
MTKRAIVRLACVTGTFALLMGACAPVEEEGTGQDGGADTSDEARDGRPENFGAEPPDDLTDGGRMVVAFAADLDRLDPTFVESAYARYALHSMCDTLYDIDENVEIQRDYRETVDVRIGAEFVEEYRQAVRFSIYFIKWRCPRQQQHEIGVLNARDEHLLTRDDVAVTVADRASTQAGRISSGIGLRDAERLET